MKIIKTIAILFGVLSGLTGIVVGILLVVGSDIATGIAFLVSGIYMVALTRWLAWLDGRSQEQEKKLDQLETHLYAIRKELDPVKKEKSINKGDK